MKIHDYLLHIALEESQKPKPIPFLDEENTLRADRLNLAQNLRNFAFDRNAEVLPGNLDTAILLIENKKIAQFKHLEKIYSLVAVNEHRALAISQSNQIDDLYTQYNHVLTNSSMLDFSKKSRSTLEGFVADFKQEIVTPIRLRSDSGRDY